MHFKLTKCCPNTATAPTKTPITPATSLQQLFQKEKQAANRKRQKHKHLHERKKQQALERQRNERYLLNELLNHNDNFFLKFENSEKCIALSLSLTRLLLSRLV